MLCGCSNKRRVLRSRDDDDLNSVISYYYSKDDSGVYTGTEDSAELVIKKTYSPSQRKIASLKHTSQLKADQAYPSCFAWNEAFCEPRHSKDDLGKLLYIFEFCSFIYIVLRLYDFLYIHF